jgi:hypothetical protein
MATTSFTVRQFFSINNSSLPLPGELPEGVFIVTGSQSNMFVNNNRTDLSIDDLNPYGTSGGSQGWWPGPSTNTPDPIEINDVLQGVIVGGNQEFANSTPDGRTSYVSCWGFAISASGESAAYQTELDTEFIALAGYILGATYVNTGSAKSALIEAGYYYQYPRGFDGQSPNTGNGSDTR